MELSMNDSVENPQTSPPEEPSPVTPQVEKKPETEKPPIPVFAIVAFVVTALLFGTALLSGFEFNAPNLVLFLGRFHPVLLHLPIGLLVGLLSVEITNALLSSADLRPAAWTLLWLTSISAVLTALLGSFLAMSGGYNEVALFRHRWLGTAMAIVTVWMLAFRLHARTRKAKKTPFVYYALLIVAVGLVGPAGHFGGSMTHGKGYLIRYMPESIRSRIGLAPAAANDPIEMGELEYVDEEQAAPEVPEAEPGTEPSGDPSPPAEAVPVHEGSAFSEYVLPVLKDYCGICHGAEKEKGGLRLDSIEAVLRGSHDGPVLTPFAAEESSLIQRILLPLEHDDHMPPDGKPQPGADDIAVLTWWIEAGASGEATRAELEPDEKISEILAKKKAAGQ